MRVIYTILFYLCVPFILLRLLWRSRKVPAYRQNWLQRFGWCPHRFSQCIWIHAVSLGETIAAIPLIQELKKAYPATPLLVTNMTPTGAARVKAVFGDQVAQSYIPYDLPDAIERFLSRVHPQVAIIMETELWPSLLKACQKHKIPVMLANARLSEKSLKTYQYLGSWGKKMLSLLQVIAAQSGADAERFMQLGAMQDQVHILGNIKFDLTIPEDLLKQSELLRKQIGENRPIWVAASTHAGEEEIILSAHQALLERIPDALLVLVPRHPERFATVAKQIESFHFSYAKRSANELCEKQHAVYLADTVGELLLLYSIAEVAFVGGSFVSLGGHNTIEPAALGKPIITGPSYYNFSDVSQKLLDARGMILVKNKNELTAELITLFSNSEEKYSIGKAAKNVVTMNQGAVMKHIELIRQLLNS